MSNDTPSTRPAAKRKLGRGLGALLGETKREEPLVSSVGRRNADGDKPKTPMSENLPGSPGLAMLAISTIKPNPDQPRSNFDEAALDELAASIAARGVIQPIIVRPKGKSYQLVAGERRWRAAQKAQLHEIPALIRELSDRDVSVLALIENVQREDLNPVEEARAYQQLSDQQGLTQAEIAKLVEKSRSHVANLLRLLSLPAEVIEFVEAAKLSMGHARALVGHDQALELAREAVSKKLSVREIEKLARSAGKVGKKASKAGAKMGDPAKDADIAAVQNHLQEFLGLAVRINTDADPRSGAVTIRYRTLDQLDLICQRLTGGGI